MGSFHVKFDILEYKEKGVLPSLDDYLKHDEIINYRDYEKGNIDSCIWQKHVPTAKELGSETFKEREVTRILKTGAWIAIKDTVLWLPPNYYQRLQYGKAGPDDFEFRLKRLKIVYFKLWARMFPLCIGTMIIKNRQDGETTETMADCLWECADDIMLNGQLGIQSKTRDDAENPCWLAVQTIWQGYPQWLKDLIYSDFISGDKIAEKIKFMRDKDEINGLEARNVLFKYYPAVYNAMDGKNNMKKCVLDEFLKWVEVNFGDSYTCYKKFIMPGFQRRGMFDMFSSPPDKDCKSYQDGYQLYLKSDVDAVDMSLPLNQRTTESGIFRYVSNPLEGILGAYDKWGDADPEMIYAKIMKDRKAAAPDQKLAEIRAFPLTEEEIWGSMEAASVWSNTEGIKERKLYIIGRRFKDNVTKEPIMQFGNLERVDGYIDGDVEFRPADISSFDLNKGRFCFSYLPREDKKEPLIYDHNGKPLPPKLVENIIGLDPFNHRYAPKDKYRQSNAGMINRKFLDFFETGIVNCPTMIYDCRTQHKETMYEDTLRAAVFNRALIQYENRHKGFEEYAEDRGYLPWLLPTIGAPKGSNQKGDAPSGRGATAFLDEAMALLDRATNKPIREGDPYYLEQYWFIHLLTAYLKFDPNNTQPHNLVMADLQALLGIVKMKHRKTRKPSELNGAAMEYLLN